MSRCVDRSRKVGRRDLGSTLVELLMVVVVVGLIVGPLSAAVIVVLRNQVDTTNRLDDNRDLLQLTTWLPQDVNSTPVGTTVGTGIEEGALPSGCSTPDTGVGLLRLTWTEKPTNAPATTYRVSYRAVTTGPTVIVKRTSCTNFGAATVGNASKGLALLPGGQLPVAVVATASHVTLSVTQRAGTPDERIVKIEADSKNPALAALPAPPPPPPPPTLNLNATNVDAGLTMTATVAGFRPNEPVSYYIDYTYTSDTSLGALATTTADASGSASTTLTIPLFTTNGTHMLFAVGDSDSFASRAISVKNGTLTLSNNGTDSSVVAGGTITATVDGFTIGAVITFLMDDNTVLGTLTYANGTNGKTKTLTIPLATTGGLHIITAKSSTGRRAVSDPPVDVRAAFSLSPTTVAESFSTSAVLYGFRASEAVTYRLDSITGPIVGTAVADITGFTKSSITIPPFTTAGQHQIFATGDDIGSSVANVSVTQSLREFKISTTTPTVIAGGNATLALQATINGTNDPTVNGDLPITVTGRSPSPNATTPAAAPTTATFTNGVATITVNLVNAAPTTVIVSRSVENAGVQTGSSPPIAVSAAAVATIRFADGCLVGPIGAKWISGILTVDAYGNAVSNAAVSITFSPAVSNSTSVSSLDWTGWTTVTANVTYTSLTDQSGNTPSFTASGPKGNVSKPATTINATSNGTTTSCVVTS